MIIALIRQTWATKLDEVGGYNCYMILQLLYNYIYRL